MSNSNESEFNKEFDEKFGKPFWESEKDKPSTNTNNQGSVNYYYDARRIINNHVDLSTTVVNNTTEVRKSDNKLTLAAGDSVLGLLGGAVGKLLG